MTIDQASRQAIFELTAAEIETPRLDAQLLLAFVLACRREDLAREPERVLNPTELTAYRSVVSMRSERVPLPYITGEQAFYGRTFQVTPAVLIPRPETELLVEVTLVMLRDIAGPKLIDVGTGSGCIAISLACERPDAQVWATDISVEALTIARHNCSHLTEQMAVTFLQGDLLEETVANRMRHIGLFDAIVSNPPYVSTGQMEGLQSEVRVYEPRLALVGKGNAAGVDGTGLYARLIDQAFDLLSPSGRLLLEVGVGQADLVRDMATQRGFRDIAVYDDLSAIPRVVTAIR